MKKLVLMLMLMATMLQTLMVMKMNTKRWLY